MSWPEIIGAHIGVALARITTGAEFALGVILVLWLLGRW